MSIRLIIGLANPGERYALTRHNAGAWFVQQLAQDVSFTNESKLHARIAKQMQPALHYLAIPTDYMNESGIAVQAIAHYYKIAPEAILIAHDDIDLPPGTVRLKAEGGHGGHNGLRDIFAHLSTDKFWRLRIGVGKPAHSSQVIDYVLKPIHDNDEKALVDRAIDRAVTIVPHLLAGQFQKAMHDLHTGETHGL